MPNSLPRVSPRQAYVEVYFTYTTVGEADGFSLALSGARGPSGDSALENSAAALRERIEASVGSRVRLDPLRSPITHSRRQPMAGGRVENPGPGVPNAPCCIVTTLIKTPLGIHASSHMEKIYDTQVQRHGDTFSLTSARATEGTRVGNPASTTDFSKGWSVRARGVDIGQSTCLNLMPFFTNISGPCRLRAKSSSLLSLELESRHDIVAGIDPSVRVLDRQHPELDRIYVAGKDIIVDMELLKAPTIATAFTALSPELVAESDARRARYAVADPWA